MAEEYPRREVAAPGDNLAARVRGEVTHRLLETLAHGQPIPDEPAVVAALVGSGLSRDVAQGLSPEILAEVEACWEDSLFQSLLTNEVAVSEWLLEDQPTPGVIRRGRLDLLSFNGREWWVVDFKTSRPPQGENWDDFLRKEGEKYRPQLLAYREMVAQARGLSPEAIRLALYFTACRQVVEL
jgi:ATP-dependent helicase/nuclease subunit A